LRNLSGVTVTPLRLGDDSVDDLLPPTTASSRQKDETADKSIETPLLHALDDGALLLILLIPLVALLYRRGWILSLSFTLILPLGLAGSLMPTPSYAATELPDFTDVFQSPNQQAYKAWEGQNYKAAAALFEDNQWRASTFYRLGKYAEAAALFEQDHSANGYYNHANALAKSGQLEQAKTAYENAIKQRPDFPEAQKNLDLVTQLLQQQTKDSEKKPSKQPSDSGNQKSESDPEKSSDSQTGEPSADSGNDQDNNQDSASNGDQGNPSEQKKQGEAASDSSSTDLSDTSDIKASKKANEAADKPQAAPDSTTDTVGENADKPSQSADSQTANGTADTTADITDDKALPGLADSKLSEQSTDGLSSEGQTPTSEAENPPTEAQQATRNWLKQIPDEPGVFLKRKFEYQYQQQSAQPTVNSSSSQSTNQPSNKQW
jgi:Ca-activated chloride channel family protein